MNGSKGSPGVPGRNPQPPPKLYPARLWENGYLQLHRNRLPRVGRRQFFHRSAVRRPHHGDQPAPGASPTADAGILVRGKIFRKVIEEGISRGKAVDIGCVKWTPWSRCRDRRLYRDCILGDPSSVCGDGLHDVRGFLAPVVCVNGKDRCGNDGIFPRGICGACGFPGDEPGNTIVIGIAGFIRRYPSH